MKYIYGLIFFFCLCVSANAQIIKTDDGRRIRDFEISIQSVQSKIDDASKRLEELSIKYSPEYRGVIAIKELITELQQQKASLEAAKTTFIATHVLTKHLPNTNVELLKVIAVQNERIIDLLEQLVRRPQ